MCRRTRHTCVGRVAILYNTYYRQALAVIGFALAYNRYYVNIASDFAGWLREPSRCGARNERTRAAWGSFNGPAIVPASWFSPG